jgi:hypothetical protein
MVENTPSKFKMTPARLAAARQNGRKSKGPKTPAGRKISSRNSLKHALACTAKTPLLLPGEDEDRLRCLIQGFEQIAGPGRTAILDTLVAESWRVLRALKLETSRIQAFSAEENEIADATPSVILAHAWDELSYEPVTAAVNRHTSAARSRFRRALQQLHRPSNVVPIRT